MTGRFMRRYRMVKRKRPPSLNRHISLSKTFLDGGLERLLRKVVGTSRHIAQAPRRSHEIPATVNPTVNQR